MSYGSESGAGPVARHKGKHLEKQMKTRLAVVCTLALVAMCNENVLAETNSVPASAAASSALSEAQKQAYVVGIMNAKQVKEGAGIDNLDMDTYLQGFKAGYSLPEDKWLLNEKEMQDVVMDIRKTATKKHEEKQLKQQSESKAKGEAFLLLNAAKAGVKTTASGLQYEVIKEGNGPTPKDTEIVKVNYKGTLVDGEVFDQNNGVTFGVTQVIPGWTEALRMMKVGSKYRLAIPSKLAYGEKGTGGGRIPPNAALVFDVELVAIQEAGTLNQPPAPGKANK